MQYRKRTNRLRRAAAVLRRLAFERRTFQWWPAERAQSALADNLRWIGAVGADGQWRQALYVHPFSEIVYRIDIRPGDAVAADCVLVTNNLADFQHYPGLRLENWVTPSDH